jgi:hypothetical protein
VSGSGSASSDISFGLTCEADRRPLTEHRKVTQISFKPDWTREGKAAPFKRNDRLLDVLPIGLVVFAGSGITDNLADKAKKLGIRLLDYRKRGA